MIADNRREMIANEILDSLIGLFCHPRGDKDVRLNVAKTLANLAANENCRKAVFTPEVLRPLIKMIHARRKKEARDVQVVAISALCNMTATPELCHLLIEQKGMEHVVELLFVEDDAIRSRASQTVLNMAYRYGIRVMTGSVHGV